MINITEVSYKNFVKKIEKTARALKNYGVKEGDRVTICMPNTPEGITMVYAVNMVGAVCNMVRATGEQKPRVCLPQPQQCTHNREVVQRVYAGTA